MPFKLLTAVLAILLAAESAYVLMHRHPTNRFKPVEGYDGVVAFDTATGQLCKTPRTKSAAEIERESETEAEHKRSESDRRATPEGLNNPKRAGDWADAAIAELSSKCPTTDDTTSDEACRKAAALGKSDAESTLEFVAYLPACADIR